MTDSAAALPDAGDPAIRCLGETITSAGPRAALKAANANIKQRFLDGEL